MPRCKDSATSRNLSEDLMGIIRRHMPCRHQLMHEWPYAAGSTCLVVLLVWQPFQPAALAVMLTQPTIQSAERSLQEIDSNCYQVRSEELSEQSCENCDQDKVGGTPSERNFQFSRSILTCSNIYRAPLHTHAEDKPANVMIEVIRSNHTF